LGVISGPLEFKYQQEKIIIPSERSVWQGTRNRFGFGRYEPDTPWKKEAKPIGFGKLELLNWDEQVKSTKDYSLQWALLFGTDQVQEYLRIDPALLMTISLKKLIQEKEKWTFFRRHPNPSYADALELLGVEVPFDFKLARDRQPSRQLSLFKELYAASMQPSVDAEKLRVQLQYAVQAGIPEMKENFSPKKGLVVYVGEFTRGLCQEYGVPITQNGKSSG